MTQRTWKERDDWAEGNRRTLEPGKFGEEEEKSRKEKDDWRGTGMGGESWRQRRENWRVKEKGLRRGPRLRWVDWDTGFMPTGGPQIAEDRPKDGRQTIAREVG